MKEPKNPSETTWFNLFFEELWIAISAWSEAFLRDFNAVAILTRSWESTKLKAYNHIGNFTAAIRGAIAVAIGRLVVRLDRGPYLKTRVIPLDRVAENLLAPILRDILSVSSPSAVSPPFGRTSKLMEFLRGKFSLVRFVRQAVDKALVVGALRVLDVLLFLGGVILAVQLAFAIVAAAEKLPRAALGQNKVRSRYPVLPKPLRRRPI